MYRSLSSIIFFIDTKDINYECELIKKTKSVIKNKKKKTFLFFLLHYLESKKIG